MSNSKPLTDDQKRQIIPLINDQGLTEVQIANKWGKHPQTIRYWVRKLREEAKRQGVELKINTRVGRRANPIQLPHGDTSQKVAS